MKKFTVLKKKQNKKRRFTLHVLVMMCLMTMLGVNNASAQGVFGGGTGTESDPYLISTKANFSQLIHYASNGAYQDNPTKIYFRMTSNIDMENESLYDSGPAALIPFPIKNMVFDGNGYTISNVKIPFSGFTWGVEVALGLFRNINSSTIKNLTLSGFEFHGHSQMGGLFGTVGGTCLIENCHVKNGKIYGHAANDNGNITAPSYIGGLLGTVGSNTALTVTGCSVASDVQLSFCISIGNAPSDYGTKAGGFAGTVYPSTVNIYDCIFSTDVNSNMRNSHTCLGGLIGENQGTVNMARVLFPWNNVFSPNNTSHWRGNIVGVNYGTITAYATFLAEMNIPVGVNYGIHGTLQSYSALNSIVSVYNNLERINNTGGTIASGSSGNQMWNFDPITRKPYLTKSNYVIRLTKGSNISNMSSVAGGSEGDIYYYTSANKDVTITSNANQDSHHLLNFYLDYSKVHTIQQGSSVKTYTYCPNKDGIFTAELKFVPYTVDLSGSFDQWTNKINLRWGGWNTEHNVGGWYIYKRLKGTTGAWTRYQSASILSGNNYYLDNISLAETDWDKDWDIAVSYIPSTEAVPNSPHPYNSANIEVNTTPKISVSSFTAEGSTEGIKISAVVPTQLTNTTLYKYAISRSVDGVTYSTLISEQSFNGSGMIEYTDNNPASSCIPYTYRLEITAFNRVFHAHSNYARTLFGTNLTSFKSTKGEYSDKVRLEWETNKVSTETTDRYKVFRKVATNPDDVWTEMATINTNEISYIYTDDQTMPGIYYKYKVTLYQVCSEAITELVSKEDIGFSQSLGAVSGRVTYGSGVAVKDVSVSLVRNDLQTSESQYRSLRCEGDGKVFAWQPASWEYYENITNSNFTYQFWINPDATTSTSEKAIGEFHEFLGIYLIPSQDGNMFSLCVKGWTTSGYSTFFTTDAVIQANRFTHISLVRNGNSFICHIVNEEDLADIQINTYSTTADFSYYNTQNTRGGIIMGLYLPSYIDECRLWSRALSVEEIRRDYNRMLIGSEEGLKAYWTFDEGLDGDGNEAGYFFDISCVGTIFNRNHGRHDLASSTVIPTIDQLGLKGITDANGNYQIRGIPFSGTGSSYDVVPTLGVHNFNPTSHLRIVSNNSLIHNGVDFTDVSTFNLSGSVVYEGGNYPVTGCNFEIDGVVQTKSDGSAVTNEDDGSFVIKVPIGEHTVRVVKTGHTFANNGYLTMPEGGYNKHETDKRFYDQTRVKLIGRVVGGLTEHNKPLGFGESVNNTGASVITLTAARSAYDLQDTSRSEIFSHNGGEWRKPGSRLDDQTEVTYNKKNIMINISPETGEFVAWVYPEVYNIGEIKAPYYVTSIYNKNESINLSTAAVPDDDMMKTSIRTWKDSVLIQRPGQIDYYDLFENSDTVRYHAEWKIYCQALPTFNITQLVGETAVPYFGEKEYTFEDELTGDSNNLVLWDQTNGYLFDFPVFEQGVEYTFAFEAYEQYVNSRYSPSRTYLYPIGEGSVSMTNTIALDAPMPIPLDKTGKAKYTFTAGAPDLTTGKHSFFGTVTIGGVGYYSNFGQNAVSVWHLGNRTTGTDFMTSGPNEITAILRDPPGSLSHSYIERGTTITKTSTNEVVDGMKEAMNLTTSLGPKIKSFIGLGGGVILESEIKADASIGMSAEQTWKSSEETSTSVTFTERFETSDDPLYVGHRGDVFIGNSTNIQYGLTNGISIHKNYLLDNDLITKNEYSIAPSTSLAYGQTFATRFAFTQVDLEDIMIPKWKSNLALLLYPMGTNVNTAAISNPVYVSNLPHNHQNFGKLNTDKNAFGDNAVEPQLFHDGPSYTIYFPNNYDTARFVVDSVMWFNNQINGWTQVLAQNEQEKVEMTLLGNYSIGSGATIEWSRTETSSKTTTSNFHWMLNPSIGLVTGGDVMGIGLELSTTIEYVHEEDAATSQERTTSITSGFVLKEEGSSDQITIDYGMTESGTIAFKSRGGRTSCPYEEAYITQYYEPGMHVLSEATMQIEVPVINVNGATQILNVPANRPATFVLDLKNESEIGEDVWFQLVVAEETNPHGAILKIDGGSIGNGRMFLVRAGEVLSKTLTVEKGTVDDYDNIGLILRSQCQSDPTDFLPIIADTAYISAHFVPGCSEVNIKEPYNNWIANTETSDTLRIILDGFERNYENFGYIQLEYRNVSSPTWSTLMCFYADENIYNNATGYKTRIYSTDQDIVYDWIMRSIPDASYEIRATAVCVNTDASGNIIDILSKSPSEVIAGVKDMTRPKALGSPSPVNGVLSIGDEISITFNEEIQTGMLTKNNFSISGVLNASEIAEPNTGLYFTGTGSAHTELPISVKGSFSIETWFKRINNTAGTLFSYGEGDNYISLSINESGKAVVQIGDEIKISTSSISNTTNTWKYIGLAYNRTERTVYVYAFQDSDPTIELFVNMPFNPEPPTLGKLYVGNTHDNNNGFEGAIGLLHFYNVAHTEAEMSLVKGLTKSGTEPNLIGLWEMTETKGLIAKDKARSRNLIVNTDWYIYPAGKSISLNGTNSQYAIIDAAKLGFRYFDDFTFEFQFKGTEQDEATLLSVGMTAYIEFDADNKLILNAGGNTQVLTNNNLLDGNWHHIALSAKRGGTTTAIIDGVPTATFSTSIFADMVGGGKYFLGIHFFANTGTGFYEYTKPFSGNIDEFRVWNSALTTDVVNQNKNYKLSGNEVGLIAYYPFEEWNKLIDGTTLVANSNKDFVTDSLTIAGNFTFDNASAPIIDLPAKTTIGNEMISFVASSNKIVLTINEEYYKLDDVVLDISVENILDLRGNVSNPVKWTAFVNQNPLAWVTDPVDIVMEYGEQRTFSATIQNRAGVSTNYFINNLPNWLTVNSYSGTLLPLSTKELTFTINPATNIGSYEASIVLEGVNNVQKNLPVTLKVTGERPDWTFDPTDFEQSMTVTGIVHIESVPQEDEEDILAAFIGDLCVGLASPVYESSFNAYFVYMMIGGNSEHDSLQITFKLWDASTGNIYPVVYLTLDNNPLSLVFLGDDIQGSPNNPIYFNALDVIEQSITVNNGWTWISVNVENENPTLIDQFKAEAVDYAAQLKAGDGTLLNNVGGIWAGTINTLTNDQMYIVKANSAAALTMLGKPVKPQEKAITLEPNKWNWIGYTPQASLPVSEALAGIPNPVINDQIKGQKGYRMMSSHGWVGSLTAMEPGRGYKYRSNNTQNNLFYYPNVRGGNNGEIFEETYDYYWDTDFNLFTNSMTITASLFIDGEEIENGLYEIAAFVGNECRGSAIMQYIDGFEHPYMGFLMVYGNGEEMLHFKVYNHYTREVLALNETINFFPDLIYGTPDELYPLSASSPTGIENYNNQMKIYPNPVETILYIETVEMPDWLRVYDVTGKLLLSKEGLNEPSIDVSTLSKGIYFIHVEIDGEIFVDKFIKQ